MLNMMQSGIIGYVEKHFYEYIENDLRGETTTVMGKERNQLVVVGGFLSLLTFHKIPRMS